MNSFNVMVQAVNRYGSTDGMRGINTSNLVVASISTINTPIADAVVDPTFISAILGRKGD